MDSPFGYINSKLASEKNSQGQKMKVNLSNNSAIVAAASQAIAATQQMNLGRRTASLKASYEAINSGFANYNFSPIQIDSDPNAQNSFLRHVNELGDFEPSNKKARLNKRSRTSSQYNPEMSNSTSSEAINHEGDTWVSNDEPEPRYCICNNISYGEMIYCENKLVSGKCMSFPLQCLTKSYPHFSVHSASGSITNVSVLTNHQRAAGSVPPV